MLSTEDAAPTETATSTEVPSSSPDVVVMTNIAQGLITSAEEAEDVEAALSQKQQPTKISTNSAINSMQTQPLPTNSTGAGLTKRRSLKERFLPTTDADDSNSNTKCSQPITIAPSPATKAPKDTLKAVYAAGKYKAGLRMDVLMVQSTMAGIFIAFAGQLYLSVGGGVLGAALFPGGLIAVILTSAELFTGDALIFVASVLGGQVPLRKLLRNWTVSWCCNFVGSLLWAFFLGYLSNAVEDVHATELAISVAEKKALDHMGAIFLKGVGANFLVCIAVWQGTTAEEVAGKVLALWWPTASFILLGFSHCVANMYLIPIGMMLGANISVGRMFSSILMATLGNVVGGGIFVGAVYWYVFDSMASFGGLTARIRHHMTSKPMASALHHAGTASFLHTHHNHHGNVSTHHHTQPTDGNSSCQSEQNVDV